MAGNRIIYGAVIFMAAAFVALFEHRATYAMLYAVLLLPVVSLMILLVSARRVSITDRLGADTVKKGEPTPYIISVGNGSPFGFRARAVFAKELRRFFKIPEPGGIMLSPRAGGEVIFNMLPGYRGVFNVGAEHIFIYDWTGIFRLRLKNPGQSRLTVLPDIRALASLPVSLGGAGGADAADDYADLAKYSPSEGYKRIHWPASARRGELISRTYNAAGKGSAAVIIDNSRLGGTQAERMRREDEIVESAVSAVYYCISEMSLPVSLDYIGGRAEKPTLELDYLYVSAAGVKFDGDAGLLPDIIENRRAAGNIYIFTGEAAGPIIDCVQSLRASGRNAEIFCCEAGELKLWEG